jgi:hypothetical protein
LSEACQDGIAPRCYRNEEGSEELRVVHEVRTTEAAGKEIERLFAAGHSELEVTIEAVSEIEETDVAKEYRYIVEARASKDIA